jgi:hypothetical protein
MADIRSHSTKELNMVRTKVNVLCKSTDRLPGHIHAKDTQGCFALVSAARARYMEMDSPAQIRIGDPDYIATGGRYYENQY